FYASAQFNPNNTWWGDFGALNAYVQRVQAVLQSGQPDNDVLLYWPFQDVIQVPDGLMKQYGVHDRSWLNGSAFERVAQELITAGYSIDYISDDQLQKTRVEGGEMVTSGGIRYRAIVVPATKYMPVETLSKLRSLRQLGVPVLYGAARSEEHTSELQSLR